VRHRREELLLGLLHPPELTRHRVERARQLADFVLALHGDPLLERACRDRGGGGRQRLERLRQAVRDDPAAEQRQADRGPKRHQHPRPGSGLEPRDLGLRLQDVRVHRFGQRLEGRVDAIGQRPGGTPGKRQPTRSLAAADQRLDLAHRAAVALEGLGGLVEEPRLLDAGRELPQAVQASPQPIAALVPRRDETRILEHQEPGLQPHQRRHRVACRRGQAQRRHRSRGDLTVDRSQAADGAEAQDAHDSEHHHDQRRRQKYL